MAVYLEDILIYFDNPGEHLKHVREVLQPLHARTVYAKVEECAFSVDTTDYPGFVISPDSLRMDTPKIRVILDCPAPEQVRMSNRSWFRKLLQTVYRLCSDIASYSDITSYSDIAVPLTRLTRKDTPCVWSPQCEPFNSSERPLFRHTSSTISVGPSIAWLRQAPLITPSPVFS